MVLQDTRAITSKGKHTFCSTLLKWMCLPGGRNLLFFFLPPSPSQPVSSLTETFRKQLKSCSVHVWGTESKAAECLCRECHHHPWGAKEPPHSEELGRMLGGALMRANHLIKDQTVSNIHHRKKKKCPYSFYWQQMFISKGKQIQL